MEHTIIPNFLSCQSLDALAEVWRATVPDIEKLPEDQAAKIIRLKDERKAEIETGIYRRRMDSQILGVVEVVFDTHKPDKAAVDGVSYTMAELSNLISKVLDRRNLLAVHEVKRQFEGTVI